ncbi:hypothetical protein [Blastococcus sp. SYSU DS0828]
MRPQECGQLTISQRFQPPPKLPPIALAVQELWLLGEHLPDKIEGWSLSVRKVVRHCSMYVDGKSRLVSPSQDRGNHLLDPGLLRRLKHDGFKVGEGTLLLVLET